MSHQTGISPNAELQSIFASCGDNEEVRFISVIIQNEELACAGTEIKTCSSVELDWTKELVLKYFKEHTPSFGFFRKCTDEWILISWSPDDSPVRNKMLYASTKATLKTKFGSNRIVDELFGTVHSDLTYEGYKLHLKSVAVSGPLTNEEKEREEVKRASSGTVGINSRCETMKGLMFPLSSSLKDSLHQLKSDNINNYIQISIDVDKEIFNPEYTEQNLSITDLQNKVPSETPRYHLFCFKHTYEGEYKESCVFIYSMPGYNCSIKERMLYSSCNNNIVEVIQNLGIPIFKKIQIQSGDELSEDFLIDELYPKQTLVKQKFARPAPPTRGKRRITKPPTSN
uniref:Twinfilin n=1 Tax=Lepeophtheirus salmonis TaxID=72036 RepID=C1BTZ5_LEPSM|nr:Twinfilin-2-B [Lepeophtheirus salmonis]